MATPKEKTRKLYPKADVTRCKGNEDGGWCGYLEPGPGYEGWHWGKTPQEVWRKLEESCYD